jgi:hypothetical protein
MRWGRAGICETKALRFVPNSKSADLYFWYSLSSGYDEGTIIPRHLVVAELFNITREGDRDTA